MTPITITICDDDKALQTILLQHIEAFFADKKLPCRITCCDSGEEVLTRAKSDLLFLDIQMSGKNGMETARELRRQGRKTILIFVTAMSEYVYEAFDVNAFHYLVKPFSKEKLWEVLDRALQQYIERAETANILQESTIRIANAVSSDRMAGTCPKSTQKNTLSEPRAILIKRGSLSTRILFSDIYYAEVFNRKVMLHTKNGDIEYYGKLTELAEQAGAGFYRTHRAYLVNLQYVEKYNATTIWLEQGTALLSKKQFTGFVKQYMQYINRQGKN